MSHFQKITMGKGLSPTQLTGGGSHLVVVDYMAKWCAPCQKMYPLVRDSVVVVVVVVVFIVFIECYCADFSARFIIVCDSLSFTISFLPSVLTHHCHCHYCYH